MRGQDKGKKGSQSRAAIKYDRSEHKHMDGIGSPYTKLEIKQRDSGIECTDPLRRPFYFCYKGRSQRERDNLSSLRCPTGGSDKKPTSSYLL